MVAIVAGTTGQAVTIPLVVGRVATNFHPTVAIGASSSLPRLGYTAAYAKQALRDRLIEHKTYIREHGEDMPEVMEWRWSPPE